MTWFYYIEFEDFFICIELDDIKYGIRFYVHTQIQCHFEEIFEDDEIFTISRADEKDFSGLEIESFDVFYGKLDNFPWALGIKFKATHSIPNRYAFFAGMSSWDGIVFGDKRDKDEYLDNDRFYLVKYPS